MEYDIRTYFEEHEEPQVTGFTIMDTSDQTDRYHIAEKWNSDDGDGQWVEYQIEEAALLQRVEDDECEPSATLTEAQYEKICQQVDLGPVEADKAEA